MDGRSKADETKSADGISFEEKMTLGQFPIWRRPEMEIARY
jgi:hypothetical protein